MANYRFEISFSFAGSNRKVIEQVAVEVRRRLGEGKVYFDDWFAHELHGRDMHHELERIYCQDSRMVVVCLAAQYSDRPWCKHELAVIQDWIERMGDANDRAGRLRLSLLRFDTTSFLGIRDTDDAFFVIRKKPAEIAEYLLKRHLKLLVDTPQPARRPLLASLRESLGSWFKPSKETTGPFHGPVETTLRSIQCRAIEATMLEIPKGTFWMGAPGAQSGDERRHRTTISEPFFLCDTPVTRAQWARVMDSCPDGGDECDDDHPVVNVNWEECDTFCERLSRLENRRYRLPTEAEWERACRAHANAETIYLWGGQATKGKGWANLYDQAGLRKQSYGFPAAPWNDSYPTTSPVKHFRPNSIGLYDMIGNVREWCADWFGPYPAGDAEDPAGPPAGTERVLRGASWFDPLENAHIACRFKAPPLRRQPHIGFRIATD